MNKYLNLLIIALKATYLILPIFNFVWICFYFLKIDFILGKLEILKDYVRTIFEMHDIKNIDDYLNLLNELEDIESEKANKKDEEK